MAKFHAIGRRKSSVARVYMDEGAKVAITINGKDYKDYFNYCTFALQIGTAFFNLTETTGSSTTLK